MVTDAGFPGGRPVSAAGPGLGGLGGRGADGAVTWVDGAVTWVDGAVTWVDSAGAEVDGRSFSGPLLHPTHRPPPIRNGWSVTCCGIETVMGKYDSLGALHVTEHDGVGIQI